MASRPILTLYATTAEFEDTHARAAKVRSTAKTVTVDRAALDHLLMDYSNLLHAVRQCGRVDVRDG